VSGRNGPENICIVYLTIPGNLAVCSIMPSSSVDAFSYKNKFKTAYQYNCTFCFDSVEQTVEPKYSRTFLPVEPYFVDPGLPGSPISSSSSISSSPSASPP